MPKREKKPSPQPSNALGASREFGVAQGRGRGKEGQLRQVRQQVRQGPREREERASKPLPRICNSPLLRCHVDPRSKKTFSQVFSAPASAYRRPNLMLFFSWNPGGFLIAACCDGDPPLKAWLLSRSVDAHKRRMRCWREEAEEGTGLNSPGA